MSESVSDQLACRLDEALMKLLRYETERQAATASLIEAHRVARAKSPEEGWHCWAMPALFEFPHHGTPEIQAYRQELVEWGQGCLEEMRADVEVMQSAHGEREVYVEALLAWAAWNKQVDDLRILAHPTDMTEDTSAVRHLVQKQAWDYYDNTEVRMQTYRILASSQGGAHAEAIADSAEARQAAWLASDERLEVALQNPNSRTSDLLQLAGEAQNDHVKLCLAMAVRKDREGHARQ